MSEAGQADDAARYEPENRSSSASKLRRGKRNCPVCLATLAKVARRIRLMRSCFACLAHPAASKRCRRCGALGSIWENKRAAACQSCGLHGVKSFVIEDRE